MSAELPAIHLRDAVAADVEALAALEELVFGGEPVQITRRQWRYLAARPPGSLLVAESRPAAGPPTGSAAPVDRELVGALVLTGRAGGRVSRVYSLAVHPRVRRRGVARQLLEAAIRRCREAGFERLLLEVKAENQPALALYRQLGFELETRLASYYGVGEDGLRLTIGLDPVAAGAAPATRSFAAERGREPKNRRRVRLY